ncbi:MlaD family protein [Photobacterium toruni]|uniref:Paraquat-inducible protein B n=1 Tax=Photobacterium toruni TaxID=1935446 RepID=A0A1T4TPR8_9GAMM|nr:MlaD family protein [Photobacterium toruni]SKA42465.1 Paraquat-inducible protein B [Photobacterium toruni]
MNNEPNNTQPQPVNIRRDRSLSPLWLLPLLAIIVAGWLLYKAVNEGGERIQIHFNDAVGLVAGRTTIRYQGLEVGIVRDVTLSKDLKSIYVSADIYPEAVKTLHTHTQFWLVKPKASITGISGLDALVSGNYIALQPGTGEFATKFTALENQPANMPEHNGLTLQLKAPNLGSLSIGSQIFYKKIPVGEIYNYTLSANKKEVLIDALIKPHYANLVTNKSRFWNVSGVNANIGFNGVDVQFESLSALIAGAIAFDSPDEGKPIDEGHLFNLYPDINTAGRGIAITITLPDNNNVSNSGAPIMYRGLQIGKISDLKLDDKTNKIIAHAAIEPSMSDLLNSGSRLLLEEAQVSLSGIKNIGNLVRGNYLRLIPGEGKKTRHFTAITQNTLEEQQSGVAIFSLFADKSYGLKPGTALRYRGIDVGHITAVKLEGDQVRFDALIQPQYTHLVRSHSRFFIDGGIEANISNTGIDVSIPAADQLISSAISFTASGKPGIQKSYSLFKNRQLAKLADEKLKGFTSITLVAKNLPPISVGSPVLYRNLQVGEITSFSLKTSGVEIKANIQKKYRHLIDNNTVFWNRSGVEVEAGLNGVKIKADPLSTLLKGGIAFDSINGVVNRSGNNYKLYPSLSDAQHFGVMITLTADDARSISKSTAIKYQGVVIGKVDNIEPNFDCNNVTVKARLFPQYAKVIARKDSYFWIVKPKISLSGSENLDSLLSSYIAVQPGNGLSAHSFKLGSAELFDAGKTFILESEERGSVSEGTPLLYRDIQVGQVIKVALGALADRVLITVQIEQKYRHLVRTDSVFWNASGLNVDIGITGAKVKTGTFDSLLRGGISFATPATQPLAPQAKQNKHFLLNKEVNPQWVSWRTAIPIK